MLLNMQLESQWIWKPHLLITFLRLVQLNFTNGDIKGRIYLGNVTFAIKTIHPSYYYTFERNITLEGSADKIKLKFKELKTFKSESKPESPTVHSMLETICNLYTSKGVDEYGNSLFISSDSMAADEKWENRNKAVEFMLHATSALGLPSFTYIADRIGQMELKKEFMALRLEPVALHVAQAMIDFLKTYGWNTVSLVVSTNMPGSGTFIDELKRVNKKMEKTDFVVEISQEVKFHGILHMSQTFTTTCMVKSSKSKNPTVGKKCINKYKYVLDQLKKSNNRIFLFHATTSDLVALATTAWQLNTEENGYYKLFGKDYVWIVSPTAIPGVSDSDRLSSVKKAYEPDSQLFLGIDGLFGFSFINNDVSFNTAIRIGTEIWHAAMKLFVQELYVEYSKIDGITAEQIEAKVWDSIKPQFNCDTENQLITWQLGRRLFQAMKSVTIQLLPENEMIKFDSDGYLNSTTLQVMNTRAGGIRKRTKWYKVGKWSMSSQHRTSSKTRFIIDGVTWPGRTNKPPLGRPKKFLLKVATLEEEPFVIYANPNFDGSCDPTTIKCTVQQDNATLNNNNKIIGVGKNSSIEDQNWTRRCCTGLSIDLLLQLAKDLEFEVELFEVPDKKWGGWSAENDEWNGLIRILQDKKADLVMTSLKITPNRSSVIDFSVPFQETGITIVVSLREGAISPTAFLEPYDYPSWCVILVFSVHACGAALFIYEWISPLGLNRGSVSPSEHKFSLFRALWIIWSMLFGAAVNADNPRGVASRFLANIWALFALVFLASYTANLAVFMIAKEDFYNLKGIKDWRLTDPHSHKPPFRFATVPFGATEENIKMNFKHMYAYMQNFNKSTLAEGIKALTNGEIDAFIYDAKTLDFKVSRDRYCKLRTVGNWYAMTGYGVGFPKNSRWLPLVNEKILLYQRQGKLQRWEKFWLTGACKKTGELGNTNQTLGVKNFISAFILLVGGMIFCCFLLLLEHIFYRYMRPRLREWDKYGCCGLVSISMGQLLSFEQSVNQTVDLIKHHKCRNPICEAQLWKAQHDLDNAKRRIRKLESSIVRHALAMANNSATVKSSRLNGQETKVTHNKVTQRQHKSNSKCAKLNQHMSPQSTPGSNVRHRHLSAEFKQGMNEFIAPFDNPLVKDKKNSPRAAVLSLSPCLRLSKATKSSSSQQINAIHSNSRGHQSEILYRHPRLRRSSSCVEEKRPAGIFVVEKESVL